MGKYSKIFLSSPNQGLIDVRENLPKAIERIDRTIKVLTYERDSNRYQNHSTEQICFKLVDESDSLLLILDQYYGNQCSQNPSISITHAEVKRAISSKKKIIPVLRSATWYEFRVWEKNKGKKIKFDYVKDVRLFKILMELSHQNFHHYDSFLLRTNVRKIAESIISISKKESFGVLAHTSLG